MTLAITGLQIGIGVVVLAAVVLVVAKALGSRAAEAPPPAPNPAPKPPAPPARPPAPVATPAPAPAPALAAAPSAAPAPAAAPAAAAPAAAPAPRLPPPPPPAPPPPPPPGSAAIKFKTSPATVGQGAANAGTFVYRATKSGGPAMNLETEFTLDVPAGKGAIVEVSGNNKRRWTPGEHTCTIQMATADVGSNPGTVTVKVVLEHVGPAALKARDLESGQEIVARFEGVA